MTAISFQNLPEADTEVPGEQEPCFLDSAPASPDSDAKISSVDVYGEPPVVFSLHTDDSGRPKDVFRETFDLRRIFNHLDTFPEDPLHLSDIASFPAYSKTHIPLFDEVYDAAETVIDDAVKCGRPGKNPQLFDISPFFESYGSYHLRSPQWE